MYSVRDLLFKGVLEILFIVKLNRIGKLDMNRKNRSLT